MLVRAPLLPLAAVLVAAFAANGRGQEQLAVFDPARPVVVDVAVPSFGPAAWQPVRRGPVPPARGLADPSSGGRLASAEDGWVAKVRVHAVEQAGRRVAGPDRAWLRLRGARPPPPERELRVRGYFSRRQSYLNLNVAEPGEWGLNVKSALLLKGTGGTPGRLQVVLLQWRERLLARVRSTDRPGAILAQALVLGDARRVPPAWKTGLRRAGLSHLLAVSGLHVGLILGGFWWLLGGRSSWLTALGGVAILVLYGCLVGPRPSLLRAALMALFVILALVLERPPQALNALCAALIVILFFDPQAVRDLGFQLSFLATAGILLYAPRLLKSWRPRGAGGPAGSVVAGLAVTVAAQLATLPITAVRIGLLAPFAPVLNLLFVPVTALALGVALPWVLLVAGGSIPVVGIVAEPAGNLLLGLLDVLALPFAWLALLPPGAWLALPVSIDVGAAFILTIWLGFLLSGLRRAAYALALVLLCGPASPDPEPRIVMLDVGQGEAVLLRGGGRGPVILVDGGGFRQGNFAEAALLQALAAEGVRRIDLAVLSHGDTDHCQGLLDLTRYLRVDRLWAAAVEIQDGCGRALAERLPGRVESVRRGDRETVGVWRLEVLHPAPDPGVHGNSASLVIRACTGGACVLLTGDLDLAGERELLDWTRDRARPLRSQVLKVGHHGSRTSTGSAFLRAVAPRFALVSAGRQNAYGHPSPDVVARIEARGARVLRTDRSGRIEIRFRRDPSGLRRPVYQVAASPRRGAG